MKRIIALFLSALLLLSFVACDNEESTSTDSTGESVSDETSEISEVSEFVLSEKVALIDSYMEHDIDRSLPVKNLFYKRSYKPSRPAGTKRPEQGNKLTNGEMMDIIFDSKVHVGWEGSSTLAIDFDLGGNDHKLADLSVRCFRILYYDVGLPKSVSVSVSNDNKEFTKVGQIITPIYLNNTAMYDYYFSFPKAISARYIRITLATPEKSNLVLDEIMAFEYCEDGTLDNTLGKEVEHEKIIDDFYDYELNLGESGVKVSESDADYNKVQNLAKLEGVEFDVKHWESLAKGHSNTKMENIGLITDGKYHSEGGNPKDSDYFIFNRGAGRHVVADLGHVMSVSSCVIAFEDKHSWGIATPPVYYISVSENGTDWVTVFAEHNPDYGRAARGHDIRKCEFGDEYRARYVRLTFATVPDNKISSSVYLGEWEIIGKKNPEKAKTATLNKDIVYGRYPDPEEVGVSDILWTGIGNTVGEHCTTYHVLTEETAYEYMCTTGEDGKADKLLFDSLCFTTREPMNWQPERNETYSWWLAEVFYEGLNLDAVDAARKRINEEMGIEGKAKVWLAVNCPIIGDTFNGKKVSTVEDYNACLKWMVDECLKRFNEKDYEYVELMGFYWQVENLRPNMWSSAAAHDAKAVVEFNKYVHSLGYKTVWLPYYNYNNGIWHALYYGFDVVCWQPNYMFNDTEPNRLEVIAEMAKLYGVGIEIEIESNEQGEESLKKYREYLGVGYEYGFMNGVNAYYQGAVPGAYVLYRDDENVYNKAIHDDTVLYIRGELDHHPNKAGDKTLDQFTDHSLTVIAKRQVKSVNIGEVKGYDVRFVKTPLYGAIQLSENGAFAYTVMNGYIGKDEVEILISDGQGNSKTIKIDIEIVLEAE